MLYLYLQNQFSMIKKIQGNKCRWFMQINSVGQTFRGGIRNSNIKRDVYTNGNEQIIRTRYFSKDGELIGFKLQHANGTVDFAKQTVSKNGPKIVMMTKGYKNYNPINVKLMIGEGDFYDGIQINRKKGHQPSIEAALAELEKLGLLPKK